MDRRTVAWASGLLLLAVAMGAFGAHALRTELSVDALGQWRTGVEYQFYHALGLLLVGSLATQLGLPRALLIRRLFLVGVLLFSGSLYLLSTRELTGLSGSGSWLGPLTPFGGLAFMAGWMVLLITTARRGEDH